MTKKLSNFLLKFTLLLSSLSITASFNASNAQDSTSVIQPTTTDTTSSTPKKNMGTQQILVALDISKIAFNIAKPHIQNYEVQVNYNPGNKNNYVAEFGWGSGKVDYTFLNYTTQAGFLRIGLDRSLLGTQHSKDFDMAFMGFRYGAAYGSISDAWYQVSSPFGGSYPGTYDATNYFVHWGEITVGMRLEIWKKIFLGWNGRAKFLFNAGTFQQIAPNNVAGYGAADKTTIFDFNLYLSYAIFRK